jgi:HicB family
MDLTPYVDRLGEELAAIADAAGEDVRAAAERLTQALGSAMRLTLLDALSAATDEITLDLAPGSVDIRLRGGNPQFVVIPPDASPVEVDDEPDDVASLGAEAQGHLYLTADGGPTSRINLRIPDQLRARIEEAAGQEGLSVNAWLVRAAAAALEANNPKGRGAQRALSTRRKYVGWVG